MKLILFFALSVSLLFYFISTDHVYGPISLEKHTVVQGESLWLLAEKSKLNVDTRDILALMIDLNELSSEVIHPGDVILIPQPK